jgi:hypothetical protein
MFATHANETLFAFPVACWTRTMRLTGFRVRVGSKWVEKMVVMIMVYKFSVGGLWLWCIYALVVGWLAISFLSSR